MQSSNVTSKLKKAVTQPHRIPGYVMGRVNELLHSVEGTRVVWPTPGQAMLERFSSLGPGPGEVLVLAHVSMVSAGTERAMFAQLPNTDVEFPFYPGYSTAGMIKAVGPDVQTLQVGDRVALAYPHASICVAPSAHVWPIPTGVNLDEAAFIQLGVIALQGIRKAQLQIGEHVAVLGPGPIGLITAQLARSKGAAAVTVVASTPRRARLASEMGLTDFIALSASPDAVDGMDADVTIDATGNADALHDAIRCTRTGGRIVLLGSSRGVTHRADLDMIRRANQTLIGAHVMSLQSQNPSENIWPAQREGQLFLQLLSEQRISTLPLINEELRPQDIALFYQRLARGEAEITAPIIRWSALPMEERLASPKRPAFLLPRDRNGDGKRLVHTSSAPTTVPVKAGHNGQPVPTDKLRIGLIGCGEIALENASAVNNASNATLAAVMDVDRTIAQDLAKRYSVPWESELDDILVRDDIDCVLISVPHHLHAPLAIRALNAKKHVIVEKPMANSVAEADAMIDAAAQAGASLSVLYAQRYLPYVQAAKQMIDRGQIGKLLGLNLIHYLDKSVGYWHGGHTGRVANDWRMSRTKSGGGILVFNLVHYLDIIRYLTDLDVESVFSMYDAFDTPAETEDSISISLRFTGGLIGNISGATCLRGATMQHQQLRIWGDEGQIVVGEPFEFYSLHPVDGLNAGEWHKRAEWEWGVERRRFIQAFSCAVLRGETPPISGSDGRSIQAITAAVYASQDAGTPVRLETL